MWQKEKKTLKLCKLSQICHKWSVVILDLVFQIYFQHLYQLTQDCIGVLPVWSALDEKLSAVKKGITQKKSVHVIDGCTQTLT